jgi:DNA-binding NtrC family response regulator/tetratricopeptide (TPR) repeat protein
MLEESLSVTTLVGQGQFKTALSILRQHQVEASGSISGAERLLLAELFERTGHLADARTQLLALKKAPQLTESERARYFLVEGLLSKQLGHLEDSIRWFQRACQLSERAGSPELLSWCRIRLLNVQADLDGAELDAAILSNLRISVERAAVSSLSIAQQIFLAEYSAKRGDLDASRHYSDVAESLLSSFPNVWLRGLLDLHESCLNYLNGDFLDSLTAARNALAASVESGHVLTGVIAQADMAAAYLAVGQPARARSCLLSALQRCGREEQVWGLVLETLAEAQLLSDDLAGCSVSLETAHDLSARHSQSRSAWHRTWNLRTEARLLQRRGRWRESLELIRNAGLRDHPDSRSFPRIQIEMLEALALAKLHRPGEARELLRQFVQDSLVTSRRGHSVTLVAPAALLAVAGGKAQALSLCVHALRVVGATAEAGGLVEIADQLVELVGGSQAGSIEELSRTESACPLWRPTSITCHLGTSTAVPPSVGSDSSEVGVLVVSLADLVADPRALGEEALRCLASMGWIRSGAVIQSSGSESRTVVNFSSEVPVEFSNHQASQVVSDSVKVELGSKQAHNYELLLSPGATPLAAARCYGFARLVASARRTKVRDHETHSVVECDPTLQQMDDGEGLFRSPAMLALLVSARRVARLGVTVLLTGESGTGKEVVARIIHRASGAPQDAYVAFNCATVPRDMVDSQLFGYRRGAFTGAVQGFRGVIEAADGGTLLLDEVGELPLEIQPKLLRLLDSGEVQALGEAAPRRLKLRVVAATNADLEKLVQEGRFREDLFYRLNVVRFRLPPLRERREEIEPLISMFLAKYSAEFGKHGISLTQAAREHLLLFSWPGNVRELSHEVRRLVALCDSESVVGVPALDARIRGKEHGTTQTFMPGWPSVTVRIDRPLHEIAKEIEGAAIAHAIEASNGRLDLAAERLGLSRKGLYLKRQRLGFL